ncbi:hypothetical protein PHMEG_00025063 [Phytophthora megakarya]|uniref:Uncharacterized protein n=1 Tax=Phytophthora megakarya TaxID=4795 RepID=A0A225VD37_9STRA|nr:hypothetical protein PHMEG_00025063 [Phytophthora megakarya]
MQRMFASAVAKVEPVDIRVMIEWEDSVESDLAQIRRGDLFVEECEYHEGGGSYCTTSLLVR